MLSWLTNFWDEIIASYHFCNFLITNRVFLSLSLSLSLSVPSCPFPARVWIPDLLPDWCVGPASLSLSLYFYNPTNIQKSFAFGCDREQLRGAAPAVSMSGSTGTCSFITYWPANASVRDRSTMEEERKEMSETAQQHCNRQVDSEGS